jgi:hypothetical protein
MSTETNANPNGAASNAALPAAQPAIPPTNGQPVVVKPKYEVDYDPNNPPWLNDRLEQAKKGAAKEAEANARKALLAELGVDDPAVLKKLADEDKKRTEERKSLEQRAAERETALKAKDDRNRELEESVKSYAEGQLAGLTEQQKAAVIAVAGNDPPKQLKAIEALRPTWAMVAPVAPTAVPNGAAPANAAPPVVQPPAAKPAAATAPSPNAPPPAGVSVVPNHLEVYTAMTSDPKSPHYAPFSAAEYYGRYGAEIEAAKKSRSAN